MTNIAFIGLGNMGGPMAANLVKAGHKVVALRPRAVEASRSAGQGRRGVACSRQCGRAAVRGADVVITMLPAGKHVISVWTDIIPSVAKGALVIDCSTIDVESARKTGPRAGGQTWRLPLDRCAGVRRHRRRQGRDADLHVRAATPRPLRRQSRCWKTMGKKIVHCGEAGAGQAVKICNNMMLAISMIGVSEAFVPRRKARAVASGAVRCHLDLVGAVLGADDPIVRCRARCRLRPRITTTNRVLPRRLMLKDLTLAQDAAKAAGAATPLGKQAQEMYKAYDTAGHGGVDFSGIIQHRA